MSSGQQLSIITLNTWKCDGEYRVRLRLIAEGLAALKPDIILLQECFLAQAKDKSDGANTAQHLAEILNFDGYFQPAREKEREFDGNQTITHSGLAVLSRFPLNPVGAIQLPSDPADGERVAQFVSVKTKPKPVLVVNTHLSYLPDAHDLRTQEMKRIVTRIREDRDHETVILGGDFNAEPDSAVIRWLSGLRNLKSIDMAKYGSENKSPGATKLEKSGENKGKALKRIDYLYLIPRATGARFEVVSSDVVLNTPDPLTGMFPSDHLGVRALIRAL
jgi:endonuclease/exonuclease/phosphatase family metal-dependent hydrolase